MHRAPANCKVMCQWHDYQINSFIHSSKKLETRVKGLKKLKEIFSLFIAKSANLQPILVSSWFLSIVHDFYNKWLSYLPSLSAQSVLGRC